MRTFGLEASSGGRLTIILNLFLPDTRRFAVPAASAESPELTRAVSSELVGGGAGLNKHRPCYIIQFRIRSAWLGGCTAALPLLWLQRRLWLPRRRRPPRSRRLLRLLLVVLLETNLLDASLLEASLLEARHLEGGLREASFFEGSSFEASLQSCLGGDGCVF